MENDSAFVVLVVAIIMVETGRMRERTRKKDRTCVLEKENDVLKSSLAVIFRKNIKDITWLRRSSHIRMTLS